MLKRVEFGTRQKVTSEDANELGKFPQETFDSITKNVLIPDSGFAGFPVAAGGTSTKVVVGPGIMAMNGRFYFNDSEGGFEVDLLPVLPTVTSRIVAITVSPAAIDGIETKVEPRTFLTDAVTGANVARDVATEIWRWANISRIAGAISPDPVRPEPPLDVVVVAWVLLSPAGVQTITRAEENVLPSLRELDIRLNENDAWRTRVGSRIDTLASELASLGERIRGTAKQAYVDEIARDTSRLKRKAGLPQVYTSYHGFSFLLTEEGDLAHVDWLARIEEGVRFPPAAVRDAQIGLLNPFEERVIVQGNVALPAYTSVARIDVVGNDGEETIQQYQNQTVDMVHHGRTRTRIRYGEPYWVCTNSNDAPALDAVDWEHMTFERNGETFEILDFYETTPTHYGFRVRQFWYDYVDDGYWQRIVTRTQASGSILGETFLNSQAGWFTGLDIFFTAKGLTGNVEFVICKTTNGAPDFSKVIGRTTLPVADIKLWPEPTHVGFEPIYHEKGQRYGMFMITSGNHRVAYVENNKYGQGSMFWSSDGGWSQAHLTRDLALRLYYARFDVTRVEVQLQAIMLDNGIAAVDINTDSFVPDATQLHFEVQIAGVWKALAPENQDLFIGLPPILNFRAVFTGTTDVMPSLGVGVNSRVETWRQRSDNRFISPILTTPAACQNITVTTKFEAWRGAPHHTALVRLLVGTGYLTVEAADTISDKPDPADPSGMTMIRTSLFTLAAPTSSFRIRVDGTTDNVLTCFHIAEQIDVDQP